MIIAIDGPAGVGKSTLARNLAKALGFFNLNSGNFYRAITYLGQQQGLTPLDTGKLIVLAAQTRFTVQDNTLLVNGNNLEASLHTDRVDADVAAVSAIPEIRDVVNRHLRDIGGKTDLVAEGRDMTTVVFPDAKVKVFLDASIEERAKRRFEQGTSRLSYEEIRDQIAARDKIDREKKVGGLKIAPDALYLDSSVLTIEAVCDKVLRKASESGNTPRRVGLSMLDKEYINTEAGMQESLQEEYLKSLEAVEEGALVDGHVVAVTEDTVFIDVGCKSEGKLPLDEFTTIPKAGDVIKVVLISKETKSGEVIISKQKADEKAFWIEVKDAFTNQTTVEGKIDKVVKGGFDVMLKGSIKAFLPASKADSGRVEDNDSLVGLKSKFYVERLFSNKKLNIVVTRKKFIEEQNEAKRNDFFNSIKEGDVVDGEVKNFTSFGAFIDLGGFDGLLHLNDMSWGHVNGPKEFVVKGQKLRLQVIQIDRDKQKINLSLKHLSGDPWAGFEDRFKVDQVVKGKVTKLLDFGAFIELEPGLEGLAHVSELSWVKRVNHPKEIFKIGDEVEVKILGFDLPNRKISLGVKQIQTNPWVTMDEKYPVGKRLTLKVKKVLQQGAFLNIEDGIDGYLSADDISWTDRIHDMNEVVKEGADIEVMVINIDKKDRKIRLGIKQLTEDPWASLKKAYPKGSIIEGEITSITDFGIFVKVQGSIEGLISRKNATKASDNSIDEAMARYKVGNKVQAAVIEMNPGKQKLGLSVRDLDNAQTKEELSKYIHDDTEGTSTYSLADAFTKKTK